ncbi:MAG: hypothetical protein ACREH8_20050, partial [Opitutaceae bacterium]
MSLDRRRPLLRPIAPWLLGGALFVALPATLPAHGDDQLLIDALTEELAKALDADPFIRRGELFRHHREW